MPSQSFKPTTAGTRQTSVSQSYQQQDSSARQQQKPQQYINLAQSQRINMQNYNHQLKQASPTMATQV